MRQILSFIVAVFIFQSAVAQAPEVSTDAGGNKILKGFISRTELAGDTTSFKWFAQNTQGYTPEAGALKAFTAAKDSIHILAFGGTWCDDTKYILPKFYALADAAGLKADHITLLGVDRNKKTIQHLTETFKVEFVPTFIVLKNGKEIGRVVEYGKNGMFDKELGEIVATATKTKK